MKTTEKIFETAMRLFLKYGYQETSMDAVAKEAGVAKQTIYSNFKKKENLLHLILEKKSQQYYALIEKTSPTSENFLTLLTSFCQNFITLTLDKKLVSIHRIVLSEYATNPHLAHSFFSEGPLKTYQVLARFLGEAQKKNLVSSATPPTILADQIISLLKGQAYLELLFGLRKTVSEKEKEIVFDSAFQSIKKLLF